MPLTGSKKLNFLLGEMGIFNARQVIDHLPRRYDSFLYTSKEELSHLVDKQKVVLYGHVLGVAKTLRFRNLSNTKFLFEDEYGEPYNVIAWNRPYLGKMLSSGGEFTLQASVDKKKHELNLLNIKKGRIAIENAIVPIYSLPKDYPEHHFRALVKKSLEELDGKIYDKVPAYFKAKYRFLSRYEALKKCHFPANQEDVRQGLRVLKYEEALLFSLKNQLVREQNKSVDKVEIKKIPVDLLKKKIHSLPYHLTKDQANAIGECLKDMDSPSLMYRLLQGDVGTGKTLVSALLMYANYLRGEQSAIMAPTDALAKQHFETLQNLFKDDGVEVVLLVGSLSYAEKKEAIASIASGKAKMIVGTHALFSANVNYADLGLVVIDEQHKFGVNQRTRLANKGEHADLLLMSATPIPRTLSLTIYGDLDVSTLSEFPSSKRNVTTSILLPSSKEIAKEIKNSLASNHRVYVVAPQIEGEEDDSASSVRKVYEAYKKAFPNKVSMLHGKMSEEEKEVALIAFKTGLCPILVATSVVEVGIDVKEADLMIIYDPTHFALSSLHQLRGRIGRDGSPAKCFLVYKGNDEEEIDKLEVLTKTEDGFVIAEEDLRRRGPGTLSGVRQSGLPDFAFANLVEDFKIFECARDDAAFILKKRNEKGFAYFLSLAQKEVEGVSMA